MWRKCLPEEAEIYWVNVKLGEGWEKATRFSNGKFFDAFHKSNLEEW